jgi:hypothetical protein
VTPVEIGGDKISGASCSSGSGIFANASGSWASFSVASVDGLLSPSSAPTDAVSSVGGDSEETSGSVPFPLSLQLTNERAIRLKRIRPTIECKGLLQANLKESEYIGI